jgi:hypothetical protein
MARRATKVDFQDFVMIGEGLRISVSAHQCDAVLQAQSDATSQKMASSTRPAHFLDLDSGSDQFT